MNVRRMAALAALGTCLPWLAGCPIGAIAEMQNPSTRKVEKEADLTGKAVVVIPFKDREQPYFASENGTELAQLVAAQLATHVPGVRIVAAEPIRKKYDARTLEKVGIAKLGEAAGAQLVLAGELKQFTVQDAGVVGVLHGTCRVDVVLFDAKTEKPVWSTGEAGMTVYYPDYGPGVPEPDMSRSTMRERLLGKVTDEIAKKFYAHVEDTRPSRKAF